MTHTPDGHDEICGACGEITDPGDPIHVCDLDVCDHDSIYVGNLGLTCRDCGALVAELTEVDVPAQVIVRYSHATDEIVQIVVLPREGDAGYFGGGSSVISGPDLDLAGEFWP